MPKMVPKTFHAHGSTWIGVSTVRGSGWVRSFLGPALMRQSPHGFAPTRYRRWYWPLITKPNGVDSHTHLHRTKRTPDAGL